MIVLMEAYWLADLVSPSRQAEWGDFCLNDNDCNESAKHWCVSAISSALCLLPTNRLSDAFHSSFPTAHADWQFLFGFWPFLWRSGEERVLVCQSQVCQLGHTGDLVLYNQTLWINTKSAVELKMWKSSPLIYQDPSWAAKVKSDFLWRGDVSLTNRKENNLCNKAFLLHFVH